jgi:hypothetical protein
MQSPIQSNKLIDEKEPYSILSKHKNWITITPKGKNRNKCLEQIRTVIILYYILFYLILESPTIISKCSKIYANKIRK